MDQMYSGYKMDIFINHTINTDWGKNYFYMHPEGHAFARAYTYNDEPTKIYLDFLSVVEKHRRECMGLKLQLIREQLGRELNCEFAILWVTKGTWMEEWYKRRGYVYFADKNKDDGDNDIWMMKNLTKA